MELNTKWIGSQLLAPSALLSYAGGNRDLDFSLSTFGKNHSVIGLQDLCSNTALFCTCVRRCEVPRQALCYLQATERWASFVMGKVEKAQLFFPGSPNCLQHRCFYNLKLVNQMLGIPSI